MRRKPVRGAQPYEEILIERLRTDPEEACAYLQASFTDGDPQVFLMALRVIVQAYGGIGKLASQVGLNREALYRTLSSKGNPSLTTLTAILHALGFQLAVLPSTASNNARRKKTAPARKQRNVA